MPRYMNLRYTLTQVFFWSGFGIIWSFIAILLGYYGMSSTQTGIISSLAMLASVVVAPAVSSFITRHPPLLDRHGAMVLYGGAGLIAFVLWIFRVRYFPVLAVAFILIGGFAASTPAFINSMATNANQNGVPIVYGFCRGCGSCAFAIAVSIFGFVIERYPPTVLLVAYTVVALVELGALLLFRNEREKPAVSVQDAAQQDDSTLSLFRRNPRFVLTLLGCVFFYLSHTVTNTYSNSIAIRVGGSESTAGIMLAISAVVELPAMTLVSKYRDKLSCGFFLRLSAVGEAVKYLVLLFAPSVGWLYFASMLQFFQFGVYLPATVYYVADTLPRRDQLKGQSLIHVAGKGLGGALGSLFGGWFIDLGGIRLSLILAIVSAVAAYFVFTASTKTSTNMNTKKDSVR